MGHLHRRMGRRGRPGTRLHPRLCVQWQGSRQWEQRGGGMFTETLVWNRVRKSTAGLPEATSLQPATFASNGEANVLAAGDTIEKAEAYGERGEEEGATATEKRSSRPKSNKPTAALACDRVHFKSLEGSIKSYTMRPRYATHRIGRRWRGLPPTPKPLGLGLPAPASGVPAGAGAGPCTTVRRLSVSSIRSSSKDRSSSASVSATTVGRHGGVTAVGGRKVL